MRVDSFVECGGEPPLFAARACPGVLQALATSKAAVASPGEEGAGASLPHSTRWSSPGASSTMKCEFAKRAACRHVIAFAGHGEIVMRG